MEVLVETKSWELRSILAHHLTQIACKTIQTKKVGQFLHIKIPYCKGNHTRNICMSLHASGRHGIPQFRRIWREIK